MPSTSADTAPSTALDTGASHSVLGREAPSDLSEDGRILKRVARDLPREWFRSNLLVIAGQALLDLAGLALGAAVALSCSSLWVRLPVWLLMAGRLHGLGVLMHDLVHIPGLEKRPLAKLALDAIVCWPSLMNMDYYGLAHLLHHQESNLPGRDPYYVPLTRYHPVFFVTWVFVGSALLVIALVLRLALYPLALLIPSLRRAHVKYFSQFGANPDLASAERFAMGEKIWLWGLCPTIFWLGVAALLSYTHAWAPFLLALLPPMVLSALLVHVRIACDHVYEPATTAAPAEQVAGATTVLAPWWQQLVMGPHGTNYHALHHLVPTLPNYRLAAAHALLVDAGSRVYASTVYPGYGRVVLNLLRAQWHSRSRPTSPLEVPAA